MTIKEATELWVRRDMIPVPESVVEKLFKISEGADISEITPPAIGNRVTYPIDGEIVDVQQNPDGEYSYLVRDDSDPDSEEFYSAGVIGVERDDYLPMWEPSGHFRTASIRSGLMTRTTFRRWLTAGFAYTNRRITATCSVSTARGMTSMSSTGFRFIRLVD